MRQPPPIGTAPRATGVREANKRDKRARITAAARRLFVERGYDEATVRMIAQEADVGLGTLFAYATDKRDLLFLIVNDELAAAWREAETKARAETVLLTKLLVMFRELFVFFGAQPAIARYVLRELQFFNATEQAARFEGMREQTLDLVAQFVTDAAAAGEVREGVDQQLAARLIFSIYQAEIRLWLTADDLDVEAGVERLRLALALLAGGLGAAPASREPAAGDGHDD